MGELEKILVEAIKNAGGKVDAGIDFVYSNMPELIQQAMRWYFASSLFWMIVGIFGMTICFRIYGNLKNDTEDDDKDLFAMKVSLVAKSDKRLLLGFLFSFSFCLFAFNTTWIKIAIAPKLWLVEFAIGLVK